MRKSRIPTFDSVALLTWLKIARVGCYLLIMIHGSLPRRITVHPLFIAVHPRCLLSRVSDLLGVILKITCAYLCIGRQTGNSSELEWFLSETLCAVIECFSVSSVISTQNA
ncbi:hypothetical protein B0H13DRAFT_359203 [Mycena leptocephala]|nr:hypothetical protein B0H13DRAFT_359203 [Mycena leptocephala]